MQVQTFMLLLVVSAQKRWYWNIDIGNMTADFANDY